MPVKAQATQNEGSGPTASRGASSDTQIKQVLLDNTSAIVKEHRKPSSSMQKGAIEAEGLARVCGLLCQRDEFNTTDPVGLKCLVQPPRQNHSLMRARPTAKVLWRFHHGKVWIRFQSW